MPELERVSSLLPRTEAPLQNGAEVRVEQESSHMEAGQQAPSNGMPAQSVAAQQPTVAPAAASDPRTKMLKDVENILSDGIKDLYLALPEQRKPAFRQKGEAAANHITDMILRGAIKVKEVWKLITDWLGSLPGINKYFLEQEIKIKTDRVMEFAESAHS